MNCNICNKEYSTSCDYRQGRCPHHPALIDQILNDPYKSRIYNLLQTIKGFFKK
jgi:hypothetical protein